MTPAEWDSFAALRTALLQSSFELLTLLFDKFESAEPPTKMFTREYAVREVAWFVCVCVFCLFRY
jgi:hypothetical protein